MKREDARVAGSWLVADLAEYFRLQNHADFGVYASVARLAKKHRIEIVGGEIVGLIPEAACERESEWMRHLTGFVASAKILEQRL